MVFALISVYWLDNRCGKCKKTKTFGLALLFHLQDRVVHFVRNPALPTDQPLRGSWGYSHSFYLILLKNHCFLSRVHVYLSNMNRDDWKEKNLPWARCSYGKRGKYVVAKLGVFLHWANFKQKFLFPEMFFNSQEGCGLVVASGVWACDDMKDE